jgi:hypothetical protein
MTKRENGKTNMCSMSSLVINRTVFRRHLSVRYSTYVGIVLGFGVEHNPRDYGLFILLPFISFEIELSRKDKLRGYV